MKNRTTRGPAGKVLVKKKKTSSKPARKPKKKTASSPLPTPSTLFSPDIANIKAIKAIEQTIANAIAEAEMRERNRIAADLHDGVCQHLATIHLSIDTAQKMLKDQDPDTFQYMADIKDLAAETLAIARKVSHDLTPVDLINGGFLKGVKSFITRLNRLGKIKYTVNVWGKEKQLQSNAANHLYRTVQEFIHNSEKHSEASELNIHIKYLQHSMELTIADNGKGFDIEKIRKLRGIGLESMFNRIKTFSTDYEYKAREGRGVSLYISIPV
jgi:signal transduction histidine kinase